MSTVIAEFNDAKGFNVKLTNEKIYVSAIGQEETFALRSVNGVGLYDDIEKYNKELEEWKKQGGGNSKNTGIGMIVAGVVFVLIGFMDKSITGTMLVEGGALAAVGYGYMSGLIKGKEAPKLDSYFRLMLSGGSREFKFDKTDNNSVLIAEFVNKIEETLTSYK